MEAWSESEEELETLDRSRLSNIKPPNATQIVPMIPI